MLHKLTRYVPGRWHLTIFKQPHQRRPDPRLIRFLHARLLLFRPFLLEHIKSNSLARASHNPANVVDFSQQFYVYASDRCVATAHEIIAHLHANQSGLAPLAPWYVVYCKCPCPYTTPMLLQLVTLAGATTLIAAKSSRNISSNVSGATFEASWKRCTEIVGHLENLGVSVIRGVAVLRSLQQMVQKYLQSCR